MTRHAGLTREIAIHISITNLIKDQVNKNNEDRIRIPAMLGCVFLCTINHIEVVRKLYRGPPFMF